MKLFGKHWPRDFRKRFFVGMHMLDKDQNSYLQGVMDKFSAGELVGQLAKSGCDTVYCYMSDHMGNCYYPTKVKPGRIFSYMQGRDYLGEVAKRCVENKIALVAVYEFENGYLQLKPEQAPADWNHYRKLDDGTVKARLCWNGGYGHFVMEQIKEVASQYPVAGFYLDMLDYPGRDLCPACVRRFRDELGKDPPDLHTPLASPLMKEYRLWTFRENGRYLNLLRGTVDKLIPGATVVSNCHYLRDEDIYIQSEATSYLSNDPGSGCTFSGRTVPAFTPKIFRALSEGKPDPFDVLYDNIAYGLLQNIPKDNYLSLSAHALAEGGWPCAASMWALDGTLNQSAVALASEIYAHIDKVAPWVGNWKSLKTAGVYLSQESAVLYARPGDRADPHPHEYMGEFYGAVMALSDSHVLTDILTRRQLCRLADYKVIYIPNAVCLSDWEADQFRKYVQDGGTLIASYRASLADEWGNARKNFALADVFGVDFAGYKIEPYLAVQMTLINPDHFAFEPWENPWVTVNDCALVVACRANVKELARLHDRYGPSDRPGELPAIRNAFVKSRPVGPAMVENRFGKGRCIYFASRVFSSYAFSKAPELRKVTTGKLIEAEYASGAVRLDAPGCVKITAFERPEKGQWIIHLINNQSVLGDVYDIYKARKLPLAEEVLPVHNLKLMLNCGKVPVARVQAIVHGDELKGKRQGDAWEIEVPTVHTHEMIVISFTGSWDSSPEKYLPRDPLEMMNYRPPSDTVKEHVYPRFSDNWDGHGEGQY